MSEGAERSEFVNLVCALPYRERLIFVEITFSGKMAEEVAEEMGLTPRQVEDIYEQARNRVGLG